MLVYPLQGRRLGWLLLMSGAALLFQRVHQFSSALAMALGALWWLMAFKLASGALSDAARGREAEHVEGNYVLEGIAARQVLLGGCLAGLAWLLVRFADAGVVLAASLGLALVLPAMVIVLVSKRSLLRAIDPSAWYRLLRRVGSDYLVLVLKLTALGAALALAFVFVLLPLPPWLATTVTHFLALYALLAAYHAMGVLLYRHQASLGRPAAARDTSPPPPSAEEAAMRECERLVASGRADEGAAILERCIRDNDASAAVHARFRELLTGLGDNQGLLRHSHEHVALLLRQGKDREAVALFLASRTMYGRFELLEPARLRALIAAASRNGQDKLTEVLSEEFAQRFPGHELEPGRSPRAPIIIESDQTTGSA